MLLLLVYSSGLWADHSRHDAHVWLKTFMNPKNTKIKPHKKMNQESLLFWNDYNKSDRSYLLIVGVCGGLRVPNDLLWQIACCERIIICVLCIFCININDSVLWACDFENFIIYDKLRVQINWEEVRYGSVKNGELQLGKRNERHMHSSSIFAWAT